MSGQINRYKNYISRIEGSAGSQLFRHLYITRDDGTAIDVANNGELSCAIHVSSILLLAGYVSELHATVSTTIADLKLLGWYETDIPIKGAVVRWSCGLDGHEHIGFWLAHDQVISNSSKKGEPVQHVERMEDNREPVAYYVHVDLFQN